MEKDLGNKVNKESMIKTADKKNRVEKSSKRKASYETGIVRSTSKIQKSYSSKKVNEAMQRCKNGVPSTTDVENNQVTETNSNGSKLQSKKYSCDLL